MKRAIYTIATMLCAAFAAQAAPLTPEAALGRIRQDAPQKVRALSANKMQLAETKAIDGFNAAYLFTSKSDNGFLVLAADDAVETLLGYGDEPTVNTRGEISPEFSYWLDNIAKQVNYAAKQAAAGKEVSVPKKQRPYREPIAPLCTTKWDQSAPYYNETPIKDDKHCYTGCVATAAAQVMKYHNWPPQGTGTHSLEWEGQTLNIDFSDYTFDWDNMLDVYDGSETKAQANAVAQLMKAVGYAINSVYNNVSPGTSANTDEIGGAFGSYFGYDKSVKFRERSFYDLYDWEDMLYDSLKEKCPVLFGGLAYYSGHSFVCDGYEGDGYFHINWGWGGTSNGYFLIDILNPDAQGIGGADVSDNAGFNLFQDVSLYLRPDKTGDSEWVPNFVMYLGFYPSIVQKDSKNLVKIDYIYNQGPYTISSGKFDLRLISLDDAGNQGEVKDFYTSLDKDVALYGMAFPTFDCLDGLADGKYYTSLYYIDSNDVEYYIPSKTYDSSSAIITIENGEASIAYNTPVRPVATNCNFPEVINVKEPVAFTATITNSDDAGFYSLLTPTFYDADGNEVGTCQTIVIDIEAGESYDLSYYGQVEEPYLEAGDYQIALVCRSYDAYFFDDIISDFYPVAIGTQSGVSEIANDTEAPAEYYTLTGIRLGNDKNRLGAGIYIEKRNGNAKKLKIEN
jgi:hypothetical protein